MDISDGKAEQVSQALNESGVVMADPLERPPDVIVVLGVSEWLTLAELTIQTLASVETMTEDVRLLPAQDD